MDLAKRMGKSSDEVVDMLGDLSDVAAKYNYSSVDDMLNNLSPAARDDIMKMFDKPLGSFDLDKVDDFKVKNQVFDAKKSYKEILKNPDDIKQIAKNTGLDTEDVKKVKDYLFKEKHLMPDGTYRQFDASEEIADAWKRLTNGKATDEDLLLFNHELTELRFVEEGFSVDAAHILSSVDYNWSSVSKIDDFAQKCSEIYGKDFYFGAGTSNEAIDAIVKQIDNLDGQVDDVIEGGSKLKIEEVIPPGSTHPVKVYTDGNAQINIGKIDTYIRGKIELDVEATTTRIDELKDIRKSNPENFTKEMKKELQECEDRLHNYQRSQEMSNTLKTAGIEDTIENNQMIVENLFEAAKEVTEGNTEIISYLEGVNGKVQVVSRWKILPDGTPYLATVILKPVK